MSVREREKCAADRRTAKSLIDIADEVSSSRQLVEVAVLASGGLVAEHGNPLCELLDIISGRLKQTGADLMQLREGSTHVA